MGLGQLGPLVKRPSKISRFHFSAVQSISQFLFLYRSLPRQPSLTFVTILSRTRWLRRGLLDRHYRRTIFSFSFVTPNFLVMKHTSSSSDLSNSCENKWRAEESVAGNFVALQALRKLILFPLKYSQEAKELGLEWPRGLLLFGPPGTGKTSLVHAVVKECGAHLILISPLFVHRAHAGESETILRDAFSEAFCHTTLGKISVIFIDEIDVLCPHRDSRREPHLASLLSSLMDTSRLSTSSGPPVVVVASTNRVDDIDPALRRFGRFDTEIEVSTPSEEERFQILKLYTKKVPLDAKVDLQVIAASCKGYVGADLEALCGEAMMSATKRSSKINDEVSVTMEDWNVAKSIVGPSILRGVSVEVPKVTWEEIGGLKDLKKKLQQAIELPIKHSASFSRLGITPVRGILLHGPSGCSKTTLAKAAAHAAQSSFFSLSGAELYSMYVGDGEALLRSTFQMARLAAPSIIFFDEVDVVAAKRGWKSSNNGTVGERLLTTLLTEINGLEEAKGILILAATNRPYAIDTALMRPGRFDLVLYVPPPDLEGRYEILRLHTCNMKLGNDIDLRRISEETELFTGADLEYLCNEAGHVKMREDMLATILHNHHFQTVKKYLKPSLSRDEINLYASFSKTQSAVHSHQPVSIAGCRGKSQSMKPGFICLLIVFGVACGLLAFKFLTSRNDANRLE